jgi:TfoX/Sxy family transcriptional regulator of competence genes
MAEWKKAPPELVATFHAVLPDDDRVERRKMFGFDCAFTAGNMFAGLCPLGMVVRLSEKEREELLALPGARRFEMRGRVMREYAVVPEAMTAERRKLRGWVRRSFAYASSLPAKSPGKRARRGR